MKLYYILAFGTLLCSQLCSSASAAMASEEPYNSGIVIRWKDCKQRIDGFGIARLAGQKNCSPSKIESKSWTKCSVKMDCA